MACSPMTANDSPIVRRVCLALKMSETWQNLSFTSKFIGRLLAQDKNRRKPAFEVALTPHASAIAVPAARTQDWLEIPPTPHLPTPKSR